MRKFHIAAVVGLVLATITTPVRSQSMPRIADVSHADPATAKLFNGFFAAQSAKKVEGTMAYFSPNLLTYGDATLGTQHPSYSSLKKVFVEYMPKWGHRVVLSDAHHRRPKQRARRFHYHARSVGHRTVHSGRD